MSTMPELVRDVVQQKALQSERALPARPLDVPSVTQPTAHCDLSQQQPTEWCTKTRAVLRGPAASSAPHLHSCLSMSAWHLTSPPKCRRTSLWEAESQTGCKLHAWTVPRCGCNHASVSPWPIRPRGRLQLNWWMPKNNRREGGVGGQAWQGQVGDKRPPCGRGRFRMKDSKSSIQSLHSLQIWASWFAFNFLCLESFKKLAKPFGTCVVKLYVKIIIIIIIIIIITIIVIWQIPGSPVCSSCFTQTIQMS